VKWFRIMGSRAIPWALILPHEKQAIRNHGQDLSRLADRGGLDAAEAVAVLEDREFRPMARETAENRLNELVFSAAQEAIYERAAAEAALGKAWLSGAASLAQGIERKTKSLESDFAALREALSACAKALEATEVATFPYDDKGNHAHALVSHALGVARAELAKAGAR